MLSETDLDCHVKVIKQSTRYNKNIKNIGWVGILYAIKDEGAYVGMYWDTLNKQKMSGFGWIDVTSIEKVEPNQRFTKGNSCYPPKKVINWKGPYEDKEKITFINSRTI